MQFNDIPCQFFNTFVLFGAKKTKQTMFFYSFDDELAALATDDHMNSTNFLNDEN